MSNAGGTAASTTAVLTVNVPPSITAQPQNRTITAGNNATFSVTASGTAPLSYQWYRNDVAISGATAASYTISAAQPSNTGVFKVRVSNVAGYIDSTNATLKVQYAPVITGQPQSQTVIVGDLVTFTISADGIPAPSYQWKRNGVNISGATNATYAISNVQTNQAGNYTVMISNTVGQTNSTTANLVVLVPFPGIYNTGLSEGRTLLSDGQLDPHYKLVVNPNNPASSDSVVLDSTAWPIVGGPWIQNSIISKWIGPALNQIAVPGGNYSYQLTVDLTGYDPGTAFLAGSWAADDTGSIFLNGADTGFRSTNYFVSFSTFTLTNGFVTGTNLIEFRVSNAVSPTGLRVENLHGTALAATVPFVVNQPKGATKFVADNVTLAVVADGAPPLSYQWRLNNTNIAGATLDSLVLTNLQLTQTGSYSVLVTNGYGSAVSSNAILTVNPPPTCFPPPAGLVGWWGGENNAFDSADTNHGTWVGNTTYSTGMVGQGLRFDGNGAVVQLGNPASLQLQDFTIEVWIKRANPVNASFDPNGGVFFGFGSGGYALGIIDNGNLFLTKVGVNDVQPGVTITDTNFHHVAVTKVGSSVVFYVDGVAYPAAAYNPGFTFSGNAFIGGLATGNSFYGTVDEVSVYNRALAANEIQAIYSADRAGKCVLPPVIISQSTNQTVTIGARANFSVTASGAAPLICQWYKTGIALMGETSSSLNFANAQTNDAGAYEVVITNCAGSVTSSVATLTVNKATGTVTLGNLSQTYDGTAKNVAVSTTPNGLSVNLTYNGAANAPTNAGNYTVIGTINDANYQGSATNTLVINAAAPDAHFTAGPTNGETPLTVLFSNLSSGATNYRWDFGDGNTSSGFSPTNTYTNPGSYTVSLTAIGAGGTNRLTRTNYILTVNPPPSCVPAPAGLVSWWPAEGDANDAVSGNSGVRLNGATFATGKVGQAFSFNGTDSYIRVADNPNLHFTNALTIEAWVYPTSHGAYHEIVSKWGILDPLQTSYTTTVTSGGQAAIGVCPDGNPANAVGLWSTNALPLNQWTHFAATYDGSALRVYINGVCENQMAYNQGIYPGTEALAIGAAGAFAGGQVLSPFAGRIDEPAVYSRALSAAEIQAIYNADSAGKCGWPPPTLTISSSANEIRLAWPVSAIGFVLQEMMAPSGTWTNSPANVVVEGNEYVAVISTTGTGKFFRLRK